jgi:hypothetical protein
VKVISPASPSAAGTDYRSPFKESFHQEAAKPVSAEPAPTTAKPTGKPKAVFKITPGRPLKPGLPPPSPPPALADAAVLESTGLLPEAGLPSRELYPPVLSGDFVVITNHLFPWVKHYQPGDIARVLSSSQTHSHPEDPVKYRAYFLEIVDGPRKGQKPMLFRWEFELRKDALPAPKIEGRVITQT